MSCYYDNTLVHTYVYACGYYNLGGLNDVMVAKFDETGANKWVKTFSAPGDDQATSISVDPTGIAYVAGYTSSTSNIATAGTYKTTYGGGTYDAFLYKLTSAGAKTWGTYFGSTGDDEANGVSYNSANSCIYMVGSNFSATGIASSGGVFQPTYGGSGDGFVSRFTTSGGRSWSTYVGGSYQDEFNSCTTDKNGDCNVAGESYGSGFPVSSGAFQSAFTSTGCGTCSGSAVYCKFNNTGGQQYGTYYGSSSYGYAITDNKSTGNIAFVGETNSTSSSQFTSNSTFQTTNGGDWDGYVAFFGDCLGSPTTPLSISGTSIACPGTTATFTLPSAYPAPTLVAPPPAPPCYVPSYQWYVNYGSGDIAIPGATSNYYSSSNMMTGIYRVYFYPGGTCNTTCYIVSDGFNFQQTPDLRIMDGLFNVGSSVLKLLPTITSYYSSILWYKVGTSGSIASGSTYTPTSEGYYYATGVSSCGGTYTSNIIKVSDITTANCTPVGYVPISSYPFGGASGYYISSSMTISTNTTWGSGPPINIVVGNNVKITVAKGKQLNLTNVSFTSCGEWQGITVDGDPSLAPGYSSGQGSLIMSGGAINDAMIGALSYQGGELILNNVTFTNNFVHVAYVDYNNYSLPGNINACTFNTTNSLMSGTYPPGTSATMPYSVINPDESKGILMYNVTMAGTPSSPDIQNSTFTGSNPVGPNCQRSGIEIYNSQADVSSNTFTGVYTQGINIDQSGVTMEKNNFSGTLLNTGIQARNSGTFVGTTNNSDENIFSGLINGIVFLQEAGGIYPTSRIQHNKFQGNIYGIVMAPRVYPITPTSSGYIANGINNPSYFTDVLDVEVYCNKFTGNSIGITGSTNTQGSTCLGGGCGDDASNYFASNTTDILFAGTMTYIVNSPTVVPSTSGFPVNINYSSYTSSASTLTVPVNTWLTTCRTTASMLKRSGIEDDKSDKAIPKLYPNPSEGNITLNLPDAPKFTRTNINIYDLAGRNILKITNVNAGEHIITTDKFSKGLYMVEIVGEDGSVYHIKFEKQ